MPHTVTAPLRRLPVGVMSFAYDRVTQLLWALLSLSGLASQVTGTATLRPKAVPLFSRTTVGGVRAGDASDRRRP
jgi:hypothetical protein